MKVLMITALAGLALCAPVAAEAATPAHVQGKVMRYWERNSHTDIDPRPNRRAFVVSYDILRCGPQACIVDWHKRFFGTDDTSFVEWVGTDACYAPGVTVSCHQRQANPTVVGP